MGNTHLPSIPPSDLRASKSSLQPEERQGPTVLQLPLAGEVAP